MMDGTRDVQRNAVNAGRAGAEAIIRVDFAASGHGRGLLGDGWSTHDPQAAWTLGANSSLMLPARPTQQDLTLDLDLAPCLAPPAVRSQLLGVSVNGQHLGWCRITGPSRIRCRIMAAWLVPESRSPGMPIEITLEHPCFLRRDLLGVANDNHPFAITCFGLRLYPAALAATADPALPNGTALLDLTPPHVAAGPAHSGPTPAVKDVHYEFGSGPDGAPKPGNALLREGWHIDPADEDGADGLAWSVAASCRLDLPLPLALSPPASSNDPASLSLRLGLAPLVVHHLLPAQRLSVIADGLMLGQFRLTRETALSIPLPAALIDALSASGGPLALTFVLPDAMAMRGFANGHPDHRLGLALDWITVEHPPARLSQAAALRGDEGVQPPPLALSARLLDVPAADLPGAIAAELGISAVDLMRGFESLGDNCAFGLAQRKAGLDVLGLLRFANTPLRALLRGLADRFASALNPAEISLYLHPAGRREYMQAIPRYGIRWHTMIHEPDMAAETVAREQTMKLGFLRRKFVEGLRSGRKIYTLVRSEPKHIEVAMPPWAAPQMGRGDRGPLQLAPVWDAPLAYEEIPRPFCLAEALTVLLDLNRDGPNTLLVFLPSRDGRRAGMAELVAPGLILGYMSSYVILTDRDTPNDADWLRVAANAWLLHRGSNAIAAPAATRPSISPLAASL
jgi:hypothetical protein